MRVLITHIDLDGIACAILAIWSGKFDMVIATGYTQVNDIDTTEFDEVVYTDIAPEDTTATVFDHHKTAGFLAEHCATYLFYQTMEHNDVLDLFTTLVDLFDCWRCDHALFDEALKLEMLFRETTRTGIPHKMIVYKDGKVQLTMFSHFINIILYKIRSKRFKWSFKDREIMLNCGMRIETRLKEIDVDVKKTKLGAYAAFRYASNVDLAFVAPRIIQKYNLDFIAIEYDKRCSLRSQSIDLTVIPGFKGHAHAGVISTDDLDSYLKNEGR